MIYNAIYNSIYICPSDYTGILRITRGFQYKTKGNMLGVLRRTQGALKDHIGRAHAMG